MPSVRCRVADSVTRGEPHRGFHHYDVTPPPQPATPSARKTYVLDTSVLLADPMALLRFEEHEVVLPVVVVTELEGKRHTRSSATSPGQALRLLDDLRVEHGRLDQPLPVGELGGTLRVELNHIDMSASARRVPANGRDDNDSRILAVAHNLASEGNDVTLVSKDLPMRVKASAMGLAAEEYRGIGGSSRCGRAWRR